MTYKEIKDRLSKCELTLQNIKDGSYSNLSADKAKIQIQKLNTLKESLEKQLKEASTGDNVIITTKRGETKVATGVNDKAASQLKRDPNIDSIEKTDGTEIKEGGFDQNETAAIAANVGKAVVLALNSMGESISTARVVNIKPDNFNVRVVFKNDNEEVYEFFINEDDRLILKNPSYDRDLADVGAKPSGEAVVNVDVVKDAFGKELKNIMSETMTDQEFRDAKEKERLEKHPEKDTIKKIQALIARERRLKNTKEEVEEGEYAADKYNVNVHGYQTKYYKICPGAKAFMEKVVAGEYGEEYNKEEAIRLGKLHDLLFMHEIQALKDPAYAAKILSQAEYIVKTIKDQVQTMGLPVDEVDYLDGHIVKIKDAAKGVKEGEGDDHHYIKVPRVQYKKAQKVIDDVLANDVYGGHKHDIVDNDGRGNVVFYFMGPEERAITYDAVVYLRNSDIDVVDSSVDDVDDLEEKELSKADKSKLKDMSKSLKKSSKGHAGQAKYIDKLVKEGRGDMDIIKGIIRDRANESGFEEREEAAEVIAGIAEEYKLNLKMIQNYMDDDGPVNPFSVNEDDLVSITDGQYAYIKGIIDILKSGEMPQDIEYRREAIKALASLLRNPGSIKEDMDVGHQDDEPSMLKSTAYESAAYAAKLYKKLAKYDQFDGEVDFPNWWQSKLILAKDYLSKAFHYIDSKEKQPMIDKLALEAKDYTPGVTLYKPGTIAPKDLYYSDKHGKLVAKDDVDDKYHDKLELVYKKGDKIEGPMDELKESPEQEDAVNDLRNIVDQLEELGEEARDLVRQFFPNELSRLDGYRAFEFAYSSNRYDTTLGKFVDRLEDGDYDDLDDDDYPREGLDSDLPKGKHSIGKLQKVHGMIVDKMKELAKLYKDKGGEHKYRGHSVIDHLKSLTRKKKQVEDALDKAISGKNRDQQLDPNVNEKKYRIGDKWSEDFDYKGMLTKASKLSIPRKGPNEGGLKVLQALYDSFEDVNYHSENQHLGTAIDAYKNGDNEEGAKHLKMFKSAALETLKGINEGEVTERAPGFKHDCAAKVVHEKYGKGNCIPEKHTLVKEGNKYVVTHYDVLFENGKTVKDIPVSELDIKTSNEHWHKGYKKKGKK